MNGDDIVKFVDGRGYSRKTADAQLRRHDADVYAAMLELTKFLPADARVSERVYCLRHGLTARPVCPVCGENSLKFDTARMEYRRTCSMACTNRDPRHKESVGRSLDGKRAEMTAKRMATCRERYGGNAPACDSAVADKRKATMLDRYGSSSFNNREKARQTTLARRGVDNMFRDAETRRDAVHSLRRKSYDENVNNPIFSTVPMFSLAEYENRTSDGQALPFRCALCGAEFSAVHRDGKHNRCPSCFPEDWSATAKSKSEIELYRFLSGLCDVRQSDRAVLHGKELDMLVPKSGVAVEFDGLFWHSSAYKDRSYHLEKTEACERNGIRLVHVFEDEWLSKRNIVESRLKNMLGSYDRTVYARKCEVRQVDPARSRLFQEENHIQGACAAKVSVGLYSGDELIALMTFGKCRFDRKHEWEMLRFCCRLGYHIPGAAGRLLRHFERTYSPKSIVSYADRRWSQGGLYRALGFTLVRTSPPNYWYFNTNVRRYSRMAFQKHMLRKMFGDVDMTKSEGEIMRDNGYYRIYDCGNYVFEKEYS